MTKHTLLHRLSVLCSSLLTCLCFVILPQHIHAVKPWTPDSDRWRVCGKMESVWTYKKSRCKVVVIKDKYTSDYQCKVFTPKGECVSTLDYIYTGSGTIHLGKRETLETLGGLPCQGRGYGTAAIGKMLKTHNYPEVVTANWNVEGFQGVNYKEYMRCLRQLPKSDPTRCFAAAACTPTAKAFAKEGYFITSIAPNGSEVVFCKNASTPIKWAGGKASPLYPPKPGSNFYSGGLKGTLWASVFMSLCAPGGGPVGNFTRRCLNGETIVEAGQGTALDYWMDEYMWTPSLINIAPPEVESFQELYNTYKTEEDMYNPFKIMWHSLFLFNGYDRSESNRCWNALGTTLNREFEEGCETISLGCQDMLSPINQLTGGWSDYLLYPPIYWGIRR